MLTLNQAVLCLSQCLSYILEEWLQIIFLLLRFQMPAYILVSDWSMVSNVYKRPLTNQENLKLKLNSKLILLVVQFTEHCVVRVSKCLASNKVLKSHIFIVQIQVCKFSSTCEYFAYLLSVEPSLVLMAYQKTWPKLYIIIHLDKFT